MEDTGRLYRSGEVDVAVVCLYSAGNEFSDWSDEQGFSERIHVYVKKNEMQLENYRIEEKLLYSQFKR